MTVCPFSTTKERPLRSSSSLLSMPVKITPIRVLKTRMPPRGDREHGEQKRPAPLVPAHAARVDGTHQAEPQGLQEAESASTGLGRDAGCVDDQGTREDQRRKQDEKPADQGNGAPGDRVVESVAQPVGERDLSHTSFRAVIPNVQERMLQPLYRPQKLKGTRLKS